MKRNTPRHRKTRDLAIRLGVPRYAAVGLLEMLWHATAQLAPRGDIGSLSDEHIAEECHWTGKPSDLIAALVGAEWVNECAVHRLIVHDWSDHCDQTVRRTKAVESQGFAEASPKLVSNYDQTSLPGTGNRCREPETGNRVKRPKAAATLCPARLSDIELEALGTWASENGVTEAQLEFAWQSVHDWSAANAKRRKDWPAVLRGAIRRGWALQGFPGGGGGRSGPKSFAAQDAADNEAEIRKYMEDANARGAFDPGEPGSSRSLLPGRLRRS